MATGHENTMHDELNESHGRYLLRRARERYAALGYIPHTLAEELAVYGYTKPELELQFSLGAQA